MITLTLAGTAAASITLAGTAAASTKEEIFTPHFHTGGFEDEQHVFSFRAFGVSFDVNATRTEGLFASSYFETVRGADDHVENISPRSQRCHYQARVAGDALGWAAFSACAGMRGMSGRLVAHGHDLAFGPAPTTVRAAPCH